MESAVYIGDPPKKGSQGDTQRSRGPHIKWLCERLRVAGKSEKSEKKAELGSSIVESMDPRVNGTMDQRVGSLTKGSIRQISKPRDVFEEVFNDH